MALVDLERQFAITNIDEALEYLRGVHERSMEAGNYRIADEAAAIIEQLKDIKERTYQLFETKKAGE